MGPDHPPVRADEKSCPPCTAWAPGPAPAAMAVPATATVRATMAAPASSAASLLRMRRPLLAGATLIEVSV